MLRAYPHHGFTELTQIDIFYNGLNENDQDFLNAAAGGNLLSKTTREALNIIENKSKVRYSRYKSNISRMSTTSRENSSKMDDRIDKLADQILTLVDIFAKKVVTPAMVKAVEESCVTCGGNHAHYNCDTTNSNQSSVCATMESDESWPPISLYDRFEPSDGYHAVPSSYTGTFMPPKPDLVFNTALLLLRLTILLLMFSLVLLSLTKTYLTQLDLQHLSLRTRPVSATVTKLKVTRPRHYKPIVTKSNSPTRRHLTHSPFLKVSNSPPRVTAIKAPVVNAAQGLQGKWE
nr:hypothetical protein [Tanacetum cinerariifolium]